MDEILQICREYEQNQTPTHLIGSSSPIVQNRIKTNGSLPRDASKNKSPNGNNITFEFPDVTKNSSSDNEKNTGQIANFSNGNSVNFQFSSHDLSAKKSLVPQSPRSRIKTCISSPKLGIPNSLESTSSKAAEYDAIIKSFEEKLKIEIQLLQEKKTEPVSAVLASTTFEDKQIERDGVLRQIRHLKTVMNDLESQQEEVQREMELEKALVNAELEVENSTLQSFQNNLVCLEANLHRVETQRNSNRVMQETNQFKLKQNIDVKQEHMKRLEKLLEDSPGNENFLKEKEKITEELENDRKVFEDLEFQYLEEETEW